MAGPTNLARAIAGQSAARPGLRLGTVDDQIELSTALALAAAGPAASWTTACAPGTGSR